MPISWDTLHICSAMQSMHHMSITFHYSLAACLCNLTHVCRVQSITGEIRKRLEAGQKIYMHCWGGRGRAGTLGACLLGDLYGIDADEALLRVQKAYSTRGDIGASGALSDPSSPEM